VNRPENLSICVEEATPLNEFLNSETEQSSANSQQPETPTVTKAATVHGGSPRIRKARNVFFSNFWKKPTEFEEAENQHGKAPALEENVGEVKIEKDVEEEEAEGKEEEQEVAQLLFNVAAGIGSSGPSFDNLIQVLQDQRVSNCNFFETIFQLEHSIYIRLETYAMLLHRTTDQSRSDTSLNIN
jgi:hypothetical protein